MDTKTPSPRRASRWIALASAVLAAGLRAGPARADPEDRVDVTLFWREFAADPNNPLLNAGLGDKDDAKFAPKSGQSVHPDPSIARKWIAGKGGEPIPVPGGKTMRLFLRNVNTDECAKLSLVGAVDGQPRTLLETTVGTLEKNYLSKDRYRGHSENCPESGRLDVYDPLIACGGQSQGQPWVDSICVKLPVPGSGVEAKPIPWIINEGLVTRNELLRGRDSGGAFNRFLIQPQ